MAEREAARGHVVGPHTADVVIEAWGPTPEVCLEEAVAAFVEIFADVNASDGGEQLPFRVGPGSTGELVVLLLEEVLANVEILGVVPHSARIERVDGDCLEGAFATVPVEKVEVAGPIPKGVSYHRLTFGPEGGEWRCRATVDV